MRVRPMIILKWVFGLALAGYAGAVALLYLMQRDMLYRPPQTARVARAPAGPDLRDRRVRTPSWKDRERRPGSQKASPSAGRTSRFRPVEVREPG